MQLLINVVIFTIKQVLSIYITFSQLTFDKLLYLFLTFYYHYYYYYYYYFTVLIILYGWTVLTS